MYVVRKFYILDHASLRSIHSSLWVFLQDAPVFEPTGRSPSAKSINRMYFIVFIYLYFMFEFPSNSVCRPGISSIPEMDKIINEKCNSADIYIFVVDAVTSITAEVIVVNVHIGLLHLKFIHLTIKK